MGVTILCGLLVVAFVLLMVAKGGLTEAFQAIFSIVSTYVKELFEALLSIFDLIPSGLGYIVDSVFSFFSNIIDGIADALQVFVDNILNVSFLTSIISSLTDPTSCDCD